jgi:hypothetical protein
MALNMLMVVMVVVLLLLITKTTRMALILKKTMMKINIINVCVTACGVCVGGCTCVECV